MAFWSDPDLREPLRQNRWYISFADTGGVLDSYRFAAKECSKPEYKIETTSHILLNHTFNYPKNLVWQPIQIKMVSARTKLNSLTNALQNKLENGGYTTPNLPEQNYLSKQLMNLTSISLLQVDSNGVPIEEWMLKNPIITNVNYGQLTYTSDDFVDITFSITYDYAELNANINQIPFNTTLGEQLRFNEEEVQIAFTTKDDENNRLTVGSPFYPGALPDNLPK